MLPQGPPLQPAPCLSPPGQKKETHNEGKNVDNNGAACFVRLFCRSGRRLRGAEKVYAQARACPTRPCPCLQARARTASPARPCPARPCPCLQARAAGGAEARARSAYVERAAAEQARSRPEAPAAGHKAAGRRSSGERPPASHTRERLLQGRAASEDGVATAQA
jgi:hypothetical protein